MFSHIMVGANDIEASKVFYDAILGVLELSLVYYLRILQVKKDICTFLMAALF